MKKLLLFTALLVIARFGMAGDLVLIKTNTSKEQNYYFSHPAFKVHYQQNDFLVVSTTTKLKDHMVLLDTEAWAGEEHYSIVYTDDKNAYLKKLNSENICCYFDDEMVIIKHKNLIPPAKNDGMVHISSREIRLSGITQKLCPINAKADPDPFISSLLDMVAIENLENSIQHLQDYGTRVYNTTGAAEAEQWIKSQYESLSLSVSVQDINLNGSSKNVIAIQEGVLYPDEYVICGAHYDSYSSSSIAPGADDNASGNAGVIEMARILSQYEFDRSIIYCAWTAEEIGLYGSEFYASNAADNNMNILGYFNLDMIGYLQEGSDYLIDLIYPDQASFLADFYTEICATYLPDVTVEQQFLSGGDSDHTSFNNNGYMGIFPFEDVNAYSPYIHTDQDLLGNSVNNLEMAKIFVQASLASIATMANMLMPPQNFLAVPANEKVTLSWAEKTGISKYEIYRNEEFLIEINGDLHSYVDETVANETAYTYAIKGFNDSGDESSFSYSATVIPLPDMQLPYFAGFENPDLYWQLDESWGLTSAESYTDAQSLTDSPDGFYDDNVISTATLYNFYIPNDSDSVFIDFKTKYDLESDYDYVYLELFTNNDWKNLEVFNGVQNSWLSKSYALDEYKGQNIQVRFRFESDFYINKEGIFIDDFKITQAIPIHTYSNKTSLLKFYPNPSNEILFIEGDVTAVRIYSVGGKLLDHYPNYVSNTQIDLKKYSAGIYIVKAISKNNTISKRIVIN